MRDDRPPSYPVNLILHDLPVLVVGGGGVALRKVQRLLSSGARVTVVAPAARPELREMAATGRIALELRAYAAGDADPARWRLVFSATGVPPVDRQVAADARRAGLFVNVADVPELCGFYLPALVGRGRLQIAIGTDGLAPFASRRLRERLEAEIGPLFADWLACAAAFRAAVLDAMPPLPPAAREQLFDRFFAETLPAPGWRPRLPAEAEWRGWIAAARTKENG